MKPFDTYMAENGQQSTLDQLRSKGDGSYEAAKKQYESTGRYSNIPSASGVDIPSVDDYIKSIANMMPEAPPKYSEVNPFYFDEQAAEEISTAEFEPYYDEILSDYLSDVSTTKERIGEDKTKMVAELQSQEDYFVERNEKNLDRLMRGIKEGYSGKGLYFSGFKERDIAETQEESKAGLQDYLRKSDYDVAKTELGAQRQLEDIAKGTTRFQRDTGREKTAAITGNILKQKGEKLSQYNLGMKEYYQNPNWGSLL